MANAGVHFRVELHQTEFWCGLPVYTACVLKKTLPTLTIEQSFVQWFE